MLYEGESPYQFVQVVRQTDGDTVLHLNEGWAVHSITPARGVLTGGYWDATLLLPLLTGAPAGRLADPRQRRRHGRRTSTARVWPQTPHRRRRDRPARDRGGPPVLRHDNPNLTVHTADARFWLRGTKGPFDAMFVDAYRQPYIPFHLVSREFFSEVRRPARPGRAS